MSEPGIHLFIGFKGVSLEEELKYLIRDYRPGGIVLFKRNIESREQLKNLVSCAQSFALRNSSALSFLQSIKRAGASRGFRPTSVRSLGKVSCGARARGCFQMVCNMRGRPQRDRNPDKLRPCSRYSSRGDKTFMESRSFGSTPARVSELGTIWIETLQANGISATAKHFPGLGLADWTRTTLPLSYPIMSIGDNFHLHLIPFMSAMRAGVNCIMTSHAVYPAVDPEWPATLSHEICLVVEAAPWVRRCPVHRRPGYGGDCREFLASKR